ncbi:DNA-binding XRE family transcriptional regulator [Dokdonia sp. Hel_I_63]|uniref:helix-turn-helix domain-containing protein n=1 Tax=unclassified Dokdonia TaxID=2615033 RepID=UPI00020A67FA|nr:MULTISPECIES: helix-turn-helix transcriptional regulator [unclassified Dokdonia]AEE18434.1 helix-turn-helix domain protein [Dokdonia sp. 4H-3-7-5]TVZ22335.1 DNA-binding XRE family transcriptional regulator [Dokdonia sp. Hel_I_63]
MSFFGKNIRKIRTVKTLSQQSFAELFDLKRGTLGAYEEGRSEPKIDTIIKIANYFSIPIDDLLTKELTVNSLLKFKANLTTDHDIITKQAFASIPCITSKNAKEYLLYNDKEAFVSDMQVLQLPINPEKEFRAFTVDNLEMSSNDKGLFPKDIVIGEMIPKDVYKKLNNGHLVLAVFEDQLVLRRCYLSENTITLRADHKNIDDLEFPIQEVKELWRIRYVFYHRVPELADGLEEKMAMLQAQFLQIKGEL